MNAHERGVAQAYRLHCGESLSTDRIARIYNVSRATAKRDMYNLAWVWFNTTPQKFVPTVLKVRR